MEGIKGIGTDIGDMDIDTDIEGTRIDIADIGMGTRGIDIRIGRAEELAQEWAAAGADRVAQAVGTMRNPQRAATSG